LSLNSPSEAAIQQNIQHLDGDSSIRQQKTAGRSTKGASACDK
jgi:hypothetical protein